MAAARLERHDRLRRAAAAGGGRRSHWTGRVVIESDHPALDAVDENQLVDRVGVAEQLFGEFVVDDDDSSARDVLGMRKASPGIDVAAVDVCTGIGEVLDACG